MSLDLPAGWEWVSFGDAADTQLGKMLSNKSRTGVGSRPYLRNQNVQWHRFDLDDVAEMDFTNDETVKYDLQTGDLLVCEGGEVGRCAMWTRPAGEMHFQKALHRVRPRSGVRGKWLEYFLRWAAETGRFAGHTSGSTINNLPQRDLRQLAVPIPPVKEQERIATAIEEHLSRLNAAEASLNDADRRLQVLTGAALGESALADVVPVGDVLLTANYGTSAKCAYGAAGPAVLRIPNIRSRKVSIEDLKHAGRDEDVGETAYVDDGDVLVVRTNGSRSLIGRTAVVRSPGLALAFASYLIRLRFDPGRVLPEFASMMLESPRLRHEIEAQAASSAGQYNLSLAKIRPLEIPLPPLSDQRQLVDRFLRLEDHHRRIQATLQTGRTHSASLRRAILSAAFSGQLDGHTRPKRRASSSIARPGSPRDHSGRRSPPYEL